MKMSPAAADAMASAFAHQQLHRMARGPSFPVAVNDNRPRVGDQVRMVYRNWRGETALRTVDVLGFWTGSTEHHPERQLMMSAYEPATGKLRDFAVAGVVKWNPSDDALEALAA